jgi:phosphatidylinositol 3,5-bisphosphate 5-phosphatase
MTHINRLVDSEVQKLLYMIHDGNRHAGGLKKTTTAYGILGFVRFLEGYYLLLVSKRRRIGSIGCHHVYGIERTAYVSLFQSRQANDDEQRYVWMWFRVRPPAASC